MHVNINKLISCVSVICVVCVATDSVCEIEPEVEEYEDVTPVPVSFDNSTGYDDNTYKQVFSTVHKTVNKYYCSLDSVVDGSHLKVYGSQGWTFPLQDVNLTLKYPTDDSDVSTLIPSIILDNNEVFIITGFKVILYIDGRGSQGFIVEGGVLQDNITLMFTSSQLTSFRYEFWLYGVDKEKIFEIELNSLFRLC